MLTYGRYDEKDAAPLGARIKTTFPSNSLDGGILDGLRASPNAVGRIGAGDAQL